MAALRSPVAGGRLAAEVDFAVRALHASLNLLVQSGRPAPSGLAYKPDRTPVTSVDFAVQSVILAILDEALPHDGFVAEEDGGDLPRRHAQSWLQEATRAVQAVRPGASVEEVRTWLGRQHPTGRRYWTIDPVDGTKGLLRGGQFATALALVEDGRVVVGGLACPHYPQSTEAGSLALAVRGHGAWMLERRDSTWRRMDISDGSAPGRLIRSFESSRVSDRRLARIRGSLGLEEPELRMDSQVKYLALAAGDGDLVVRLPRRGGRQENTWDHAAGTLLVEEAGGRVSDARGAPLDFGAGASLARNLGVVAAVSAIHAPAVEAVQQALGIQHDLSD